LKFQTGLSAGIFVVLVMLSGLAASVRAAERSIRRPLHSRPYAKAHTPYSSYHGTSSRHTVSRRGSRKIRAGSFQQAPNPDRIQEIQTALAQQGLYQGEPSGKMDVAMSEALRSFQERSGLPPTGKLDAASLQHLGLGSDVAGLNPPKAVLPSAPANDAPKVSAQAPPPGV
jgi:hypothetical protein